MKKKLVLALLSVGVLAMLGGCGTASDNISSDSATEGSVSDEATVSSEDIEYDVADYVTLGEYEGVDVSLVDDYDVTDEDVQTQVETDIASYPVYNVLDKTTVEDGDLVNIDYVGTIDGEEFDGGSSEGYRLEIGSGSFIEGFEDGLVGATVGDTVTLNLKFADDYQNTEVAGKDVTFAVTVNSIDEEIAMTYDTLDDSYVSANLGYDTVAEYLEGVRTQLEETATSNRQADVNSAVLQAVMSKCEVSGFPEGLLEARVVEYKQQYIDMCDEYGITLEEYLTSYYGMTEDQFDEQLESYMRENLEQEFVLEAIAKDQNFTAEDDGYAEYVEGIVSSYGYADADALYEEYGEEYVEDAYIYYEKTMNFLVDNSKLTFTEPEAADTSTEGETSDADTVE